MINTPRSVLLIAFHYPPCAMSSGVQRTLSLANYLADSGWQPHVVTVSANAYERVSDEQIQETSASLSVKRVRAFDASRSFTIKGKYWSRFAIPDRWRNWRIFGVSAAARMVRELQINAIWSTYPIATAHLIAGIVARRTGRPWIADFRDPMVEQVSGENFPSDPNLRSARLRIERSAVERASRLVFCTESAKQIVAQRYGDGDLDGKLAVISNGYDEQAFRIASNQIPPRVNGKVVLLHSGTIYPGPDRDPTALMAALRSLLDNDVISTSSFELRLRDPSNQDYFKDLVRRFDLAELVSIRNPLPYYQALAEMMSVDGLLLLQGFNSNPAIPAKLYEYLRAQKPIVGLVHPEGESARLLKSLGISSVAPLTEPSEITQLIDRWQSGVRLANIELPDAQEISKFSRKQLAAELAGLLDSLC